MATTKTITVRVDEDTKQQAEIILDDIGINLTGLFNACLKAVVREKRVPFALVSSEYEFQQMVRAKLAESEVAVNESNVKQSAIDAASTSVKEKYHQEG